MFIGEKIKYKRKELGLTQEYLSKGICSIPYLSKLENNRLEAKNDTLQLLCSRLSITLEDLKRNDFQVQIDLLKEIYKSISKKDFQNTERQLNNSSLINSIDPCVLGAIEIVKLHFYTVKRSEKESGKLRTTVVEKECFLTEDIKVLYFKTLGYYEYIFGELNNSNDFLCKAKEIAIKLNLEDAQLEYFLGLVNTRLMQITKSISHVERALEIYNRELDFKKVIDCKLLLGINQNRIGNYRLAEMYFLQIAKSLDPLKDQLILGKVYHNLGYLYSLNKKFMESISYFKKALDIKLSSDEKLSTLYLLAYEYKKINRINEAIQLCDEGLKLSKTSNLNYYYKLYILKHSFYPKIKDSFIFKLEKEIIPFFLRKDPIIAVECYHLLAQIFSGKGRYKFATKLYEEAINLNYKNKRKELLI